MSSSSWEKFAHPTILCRQHLVDLTGRSKTPPHQGARLTLNIHWFPWFTRCSCTAVQPCPWKQHQGILQRPWMSSCFRTGTCGVGLTWLLIALGTVWTFWQRDQMQYPSGWLEWVNTWTNILTAVTGRSIPNKQLASKINTRMWILGLPLIRNSGRDGGGGPSNRAPSCFLQVIHLCITALTKLQPFMIQYLHWTSVRVSLVPMWLTQRWPSRTTSMVKWCFLDRFFCRKGHVSIL